MPILLLVLFVCGGAFIAGLAGTQLTHMDFILVGFLLVAWELRRVSDSLIGLQRKQIDGAK